MKTAIAFYSRHHGNTRKLLDAIAEADPSVTLIDVTQQPDADLSSFERIGLASGIYFWSYADQMITFAEKHLPKDREVFYIYTHGAPVGGFLRQIRRIVREKRCRETGRYHCLGFDSFGPFRYIGGLAKGHPDRREIKAAVDFYLGLG